MNCHCMQRLDGRIKDLASQLDAARAEQADLKAAAEASRATARQYQQLTKAEKNRQADMAGALPALQPCRTLKLCMRSDVYADRSMRREACAGDITVSVTQLRHVDSNHSVIADARS